MLNPFNLRLLFMGLLSVAANAGNAEKFDCTTSMACTKDEECVILTAKLRIFDRLPGQGRIEARSFLVDLEELTQDQAKRRDWLINGAVTGLTGLVTIYEDGSLIISEHSQASDGAPISTATFGNCEREN
ncbi:MAG: hypothetical protein AB3N21_10340 [Ruegeria sp.]|uniref:hypothetical protein n=1 Tax=Ruegeria sp. TaxID=1879320 RepID=UPI00349E976D